jgi:hypothetical protein
MSNELFISEVLFLIIMLIGTFVAYEFYKSKDGILRKLMIWYFVIDVYVYASSALYFWLSDIGFDVISLGMFRLCVLIPKAAIKLRILYYLRTKK